MYTFTTNEYKNSLFIIKRYNTVLRKLHSVLKSYGITKVDFPGNMLIMDYCKVVDVVLKGYMLNDRVLRYSQVVIGE